MNDKSAASSYRETALESAPPIKIVHLLYEGALRFLDQAAATDPETEPVAFTERLNRVDAIVSELRLALDSDAAPGLAENLSSLYLFVEDRIREALLERTAEPLAAARRVLGTLQEAWTTIRVEESPAAAPPDAA